MRASHVKLPTFLLRDPGPGTLFVIYFKTEGDPGELLHFVNALNREAASARFTIDSQGDFSMESWLPGTSDLETFRAFLGAGFEARYLLVGSPDADRLLR